MYLGYAAIREEMSAAAYGKDYKEMEERASVYMGYYMCALFDNLITGPAAS